MVPLEATVAVLHVYYILLIVLEKTFYRLECINACVSV